MTFDAKKVKDKCVKWIRDWFEENGKDCNAIIGISGGIDSAVVAALCCEAIGNNRVKGILLPNGDQSDLKDAREVASYLKIGTYESNIKDVVWECEELLREHGVEESETSRINLPARLRMSILYMFSQSMHGRVINTCNLSETFLNYDTRWGDAVGDASPIYCFTKLEVRELAKELGLPSVVVEKKSSDGLCGKTDEDRFGFTYEELEQVITYPNINLPKRDLIKEWHNRSLFKMKPIPYFPYEEKRIERLKSKMN